MRADSVTGFELSFGWPKPVRRPGHQNYKK
jgi:hypothetical protein